MEGVDFEQRMHCWRQGCTPPRDRRGLGVKITPKKKKKITPSGQQEMPGWLMQDHIPGKSDVSLG